MSNQAKKSMKIPAIAFVAGIVLSVAGHLMWESTKTGVANAAGFVLFPGLVIFAYGVYGFFKYWNR